MTATPASHPSPELVPEDAKLVTLARASRARTRALEGAAVRDTDGRTYAACTVEVGSLSLTALQLAVSMAIASGVRGLEAAAVVGDGTPDISVVRDFAGAEIPVIVADGNAEVRDVLHT